MATLTSISTSKGDHAQINADTAHVPLHIPKRLPPWQALWSWARHAPWYTTQKSMMRIDIVTIFPAIVAPYLNASIMERAQEKRRSAAGPGW